MPGEGIAKGRQLGDPEESAWDLGLGPVVGVGIPSEAGSPFDPKKARMLGQPVETFYLNGVRGGMGVRYPVEKRCWAKLRRDGEKQLGCNPVLSFCAWNPKALTPGVVL